LKTLSPLGFSGFSKFAKIRKYFFVKLNFLKKIGKKIRGKFLKKLEKFGKNQK